MAARDFPLQRRGVTGRRQLLRSTGWLVDTGGRGRIQGVLLVKPAFPAARWVYLYCERDHMLMRSQLSNPLTGAFDFQNLHMNTTYMVVALDYTGAYRAETHDGLAPEAMP